MNRFADDPPETFGTFIYRTRRQRGMSRRELARQMKVSRETLEAMENSVTYSGRMITLVRLCRTLKLRVVIDAEGMTIEEMQQYDEHGNPTINY